MTKNKKRVLSFFLTMWLLNNLEYDHKVSTDYSISTEESFFARYSKGKVYIGNVEFLESISSANENDILIIDDRDSKDPSFRILSSYKIMDANIHEEVLEILSIYEKKFPSSWNRTIFSMKVEWFVHNVLYYLNYKRSRTGDVDFNNKDEELYNKKVLKYFTHN